MNYIAIPGLKYRERQKSGEGRVNEIIKKVADYFDITDLQIRSRCRIQNVIEARFTAYYLLYMVYGINKITIARTFNQDHTTVLSGLKRVGDLLETSIVFKQNIDRIQEQMA